MEKHSLESLASEIVRLNKEVDRLRDIVVADLHNKIAGLYEKANAQSNKTTALMTLWSVLSVVMAFNIYKLFEVVSMLSRVSGKI